MVKCCLNTIYSHSFSNIIMCNCYQVRKSSAEIERNDSGVGSETSKSSRSRWQHCGPASSIREDQQHLCEDCDQPVETQVPGASYFVLFYVIVWYLIGVVLFLRVSYPKLGNEVEWYLYSQYITLARAVKLCMDVFSWFHAAHESTFLFPKIYVRILFCFKEEAHRQKSCGKCSHKILYINLLLISHDT